MSIDLKTAFPPMEDADRAALMDPARSVREEELTMTRKLPVRILIAALVLAAMCAVALADGWGMNLLDALFHDLDVAVLPGVTTTENVLQVENEYCIYTMREAAFDGFGGSVLIDIKAKDEKTLLTPEWGHSPDVLAADVGIDAADGMTLAEYADANGYEQIIMTSIAFPHNHLPSQGNTSISAISSSTWNGNEATILMTFSTQDAAIVDGMLTQDYEFIAYPRTYEQLDHVEWEQVVKRCEGAFTLAVEEPLWTRKASCDGRVFNRGVRIQSLTLTGTKLGTYLEVEYSLPYYNPGGSWRSENIIGFSLGVGDGSRLARGPVSAQRYAKAGSSTDHIYNRSIEEVGQPRAAEGLRHNVPDEVRDQTQYVRLKLTEE